MLRSDVGGDVIGRYELLSEAAKILLSIRPDGEWEETIVLNDSISIGRRGRWTWHPGRIDFDAVWIPTAFAPPPIVREDADASPGTGKVH